MKICYDLIKVGFKVYLGLVQIHINIYFGVGLGSITGWFQGQFRLGLGYIQSLFNTYLGLFNPCLGLV